MTVQRRLGSGAPWHWKPAPSHPPLHSLIPWPDLRVKQAAKALLKQWKNTVRDASDEQKAHAAVLVPPLRPSPSMVASQNAQPPRARKRPADRIVDSPMQGIIDPAAKKLLDHTAKFDSLAKRARVDGVRMRSKTDMPDSLFGLCIETLQLNIQYLGFVGDVPLEMMMPVLTKATAPSLTRLEEENPAWKPHTQSLWRKVGRATFT